jgi:hypothetical protein
MADALIVSPDAHHNDSLSDMSDMSNENLYREGSPDSGASHSGF